MKRSSSGKTKRHTPRAVPKASSAPVTAPRTQLSLVELADLVNQELIGLHRQRLDTLGLEASGLYEHYGALLDQRALVGLRERAALALIVDEFPAYDAYGVLRAGLGEMALLLAAGGRQTIAFEPEPNRRAAIEAGRARLEAVGLLAPGKLTTVASVVPDAPLGGRALGVAINAVHVLDEAAAIAIQEKLSVFDALLVDLGRLFRRRPGPMEQRALVQSLKSMGFESDVALPGVALHAFRKLNELKI